MNNDSFDIIWNVSYYPTGCISVLCKEVLKAIKRGLRIEIVLLMNGHGMFFTTKVSRFFGKAGAPVSAGVGTLQKNNTTNIKYSKTQSLAIRSEH